MNKKTILGLIILSCILSIIILRIINKEYKGIMDILSLIAGVGLAIFILMIIKKGLKKDERKTLRDIKDNQDLDIEEF